jgi:NTE family protein
VKKQKVALVLSSGGARGMAHIGVIEELEKAGFEISSIAGSSIGSVVGGIYAAGKLKEFTEWVKNLHKLDVYKLLDFNVSKSGFIKGDKVFKELGKFIPDSNIEELPVPFVAVAVDIIQRKDVTFTRGSLFQAIRSSIAIPGVIVPNRVDGTNLVDGGVSEPVPIDFVERTPGDILVVVDLNAPYSYISPDFNHNNLDKKEQQYEILAKKIRRKLGLPKRIDSKDTLKFGYYDILYSSFTLMQERLSQRTLSMHKPDILVQIPRSACKTFEFYRASELIEAGRSEFIRKYNTWIEEKKSISKTV